MLGNIEDVQYSIQLARRIGLFLSFIERFNYCMLFSSEKTFNPTFFLGIRIMRVIGKEILTKLWSLT